MTKPEPSSPCGSALTPTQAWHTLAAGNRRFRANNRDRQHDDDRTRRRVASGQSPLAVVLGCADSRVPPEIVLDQSIGDLFVVRTAGHLLDAGVLGSLEYGIGVLDCPLVVVLGHGSCGAVGAAAHAVRTDAMPEGHLREIVDLITPSVLLASTATIGEVERTHVAHTCSLIATASRVIDERITAGRLAIVGGHYDLTAGAVEVVTTVGNVAADPGPTG